jgi:hypothetical protein
LGGCFHAQRGEQSYLGFGQSYASWRIWS